MPVHHRPLSRLPVWLMAAGLATALVMANGGLPRPAHAASLQLALHR